MSRRKYHGKDNALLVEFEFLIDLDYAIYMYMRDKYPEHFYPEIMNIDNDIEILTKLIHRETINPLNIMGPDEYDELYFELMDKLDNRHELIEKYSRTYDTYGLMLTYLDEASSVYIDVLCADQFEADYIKSMNNNLNTIIMNKSTISLEDYSSLFLKYFVYATQYAQPILGKHIYIANARYNMQSNLPLIPDVELASLYSTSNQLHTIDLYRKIKYSPEEVNINAIENKE